MLTKLRIFSRSYASNKRLRIYFSKIKVRMHKTSVNEYNRNSLKNLFS